MDARQQLLEWIEADRDKLVNFFSEFLSKPSPNPPGVTSTATAYIADYLNSKGIEFKTIAPQEHMPNILATVRGNGPGHHLVLNGHIDVFPASESENWTHGPLSGVIADVAVWARCVRHEGRY